MITHKAFVLGLALWGTALINAQSEMDAYKAVFTFSPEHVPTTKTPDMPLVGNGDIGITMGGTSGKLCFYTDKKFLENLFGLSGQHCTSRWAGYCHRRTAGIRMVQEKLELRLYTNK